MRTRSLFLSAACLLMAGMMATACSDDDETIDEGSKVTLPKVRAYILNQGSSQNATPNNDANLSFYAPNADAAFVGDIFKKQNERLLGANGQCMIEYNDCIYVSMSGSNCLVKLNAACVEQQTAYFSAEGADADLSAGIRYIDAEDGYIYASFYGGIVAKINANTLEVEKKLKIADAFNLEGVAVCGNNLYVANSYKQDAGGMWVYLNEVFVVDLASFTLKETLEVEQNPNLMLEEDGKVFVISKGNYADIPGDQLQMIDPSDNNRVTNLGDYATYMTAEDGVLYLAKSVTDWSNYPDVATVNNFYTYTIASGEVKPLSLAGDNGKLSSASLGMIAVDDEKGDIYVGSPEDYVNEGTVYRFSSNGTFVEKFDCGGANPVEMLFFD